MNEAKSDASWLVSGAQYWPAADGKSIQSAVKALPGLTPAPGYEPLVEVLRRAHDQAAYGKGKERHANDRPFVNQPMQDRIRLHGVGFATGQACKKSGEALNLPTKERQVAEILGAIVYLAGAVIAIEGTQ